MSRPSTSHIHEPKPPLSGTPMTRRFQRNPYFTLFLDNARQLLAHEFENFEPGVPAERQVRELNQAVAEEVWATVEALGGREVPDSGKFRASTGSIHSRPSQSTLELLSMVLPRQSEFNRVKGTSFARSPKLKPAPTILPGPGDYNPEKPKGKPPAVVMQTSERGKLFAGSEAPGPGTYYPIYQLK